MRLERRREGVRWDGERTGQSLVHTLRKWVAWTLGRFSHQQRGRLQKSLVSLRREEGTIWDTWGKEGTLCLLLLTKPIHRPI
jgi:asparagine synthetase A